MTDQVPALLTRRGLLRALAGGALAGLGCRSRPSTGHFRAFPIRNLDGFLTPADDFFIRDHFGVPRLPNASNWKVAVTGEVEQSLSVALAAGDLPKLELPVTLECAGNAGRNHPERGRAWGGASTAVFEGFSLAAVLALARPRPGVREVVLEGADSGSEPGAAGVLTFARSVPLAAAFHPSAMLATRMNGEALPARHGGPLRAVFPGRYATDSVKWLRRIRLVTEPFQGFYQERRYRRAGPGDPRGESLGRLRIQSEICNPSPHQTLRAGRLVDINGVAWGGEAGVARVDVSVDGGATFAPATFLDPARPTCWRRWSLVWRPERMGSFRILARATDGRGSAQPFASDDELGRSHSLSGPTYVDYANNSVPRIDIQVA
ncbi:MAG TPA: molybdopterin-dependent oxidoreductase [Myxococcales bacterium]|nr:molybdopterin-dependent oxidoreductase [Myxococcales bacterium]